MNYEKNVLDLTKALREVLDRLKIIAVAKDRRKAAKARPKRIASEPARDSAEHKLPDEWSRLHEAQFRSLTESVKHHAIMMLDRDGRIVSWNKRAALMTGYTAEEILDKRICCFDPADDSIGDNAEDMLMTARSAGQWAGERWQVRKDGGRFWANVVVTAVRDPAGRLLGFINVTGDLSERKATEAAMERAKEEAEAANQAKSNFLANISHEVRTPMTGIMGMAGLLAETSLSAKQREYCEIIRRSSESLLTVINDILDFSKAEAGKIELETISFDLRAAVEEVTELFASQAARKEIELVNFVRYDVPTALEGDPGRLRQILSNLVHNALKFTPRGEVALRVRVMDQNATTAILRFEVADTGIGITEEAIHQLFHPFTQADASMTRKFDGTGLGLAICRKLVALMGGEIGLQSEIGKGSTFWLTVPLLKQQGGARQTFKPRHHFKDLRALVVESSLASCEVLAHYLDALGIQCHCTDNGIFALRLLRRGAAQGAPYDLVIMDFKVLALDGLELARAIRQDTSTGAPKLILLASVGVRGDAKLAEQAGFDAYLTKPVGFSCLTDCLALVLGSTSTPGGVNPLVTRHTVAEMKSQRRMRVLVADDNHITQKIVAGLLEGMGHRADVVGSGKEALEAFILVPYDVVLMDLQLPDPDGIEACRRIRALANEIRRRTSIIAVIPSPSEGDRPQHSAAGYDGCIAKPINPRDLKAVIDAITAGAVDAPLEQNGDGFLEEIFNVSEALALVEGNRDLLAKVARMFLEIYPGLLTESREAISRSDCELLARAARTLASSAGQLGAARVRAAAKKLEELSRSGNLARAAVALNELDSEIRLVASTISDDSNLHHSWLRAEA